MSWPQVRYYTHIFQEGYKPWKICQGITLIFLLKFVSIVQLSLHPQLTSRRVRNWLNMVICYNTHMLLHKLPSSVIYLFCKQTKHSPHLVKFCHLALLCCTVCPMLKYFFSFSTHLTKNKPDSHGYYSLFGYYMVDDHHHHHHHHPHHHHNHNHHHHHHPRSLLHSSLAGSQRNTDLTDQAPLIHCSTINFLLIQHELSITAFWIWVYTLGWGLNSSKRLLNLFGIIPIVDSTNGSI